MKFKNAILVCGLMIASLLSGCGLSNKTTNTGSQQPVTSQNEQQQVEDEIIEEEIIEESETSTDEEGKPSEGEMIEIEEEVEEEKEEVSTDVLAENAVEAYKALLESTPAMDLEASEIYDASFGYDDNQELFGEHYDYFVLADLNQDGVPELIVQSIVNFRNLNVFVFAYTEDGVVLLEDPNNEESPCTFTQNSAANGAYRIYICESFHLHNVWRGANPMGEEEEENTAYLFDGQSLSICDCDVYESEQTMYVSDEILVNTTENVEAITW